jgi:hypothetical protein
MEFSWSIVGWIAGLVFVYLFGIFEGRGQGYKKRKAEEEQEKKEQPAPPPTVALANPETITVEDPGILRIKNEKGSFTLDLDGQRVNPISLSTDQRKRLIEMLNIMRPWLEGRAVPAQAAKPSAPPSPLQQPATLEERLSAFGGAPPENKPAPPKPAAPPLQRPATTAKEDRPVAPANSIVGQIDAILQEQLAGTALEERGIFLAQSPEGGVMVYVGLTRYNGIDDVPDAEIKAAIRAAISEWENKYTPGL